MFLAIHDNLDAGVKLLKSLNEDQYCDTSVEPYHSSIGGHIRHVLDIYHCIFDGLESGVIDLTARERNACVECNITDGLAYFTTIKAKIDRLVPVDLEKIVRVRDDLGMGMEEHNYTLAAALIQAHSHATHHFASIGYILSHLGLEIPTSGFGFNPTTPRENLEAAQT
ncbi:MAG TPA: DinB family protein [Hellea balneolensis]|uniref:DinB family protein n=1 Tax=Hellea balneolensis TaxID=287478 RepID=A0A7C5LUW1_9PROT|nr:DinB family protein [Hellea balneolensis]